MSPCLAQLVPASLKPAAAIWEWTRAAQCGFGFRAWQSSASGTSATRAADLGPLPSIPEAGDGTFQNHCPPGLQADCMGKAPDELDKSEAALAGFP